MTRVDHVQPEQMHKARGIAVLSEEWEQAQAIPWAAFPAFTQIPKFA